MVRRSGGVKSVSRKPAISFPNNWDYASQLSDRNRKLLSPKTSDPCGLVTYGARGVSNEYQYVSRVDYQRTDKDSIFGRVLFTKYHKPNAYALTPSLLLTSQTAAVRRVGCDRAVPR